MNTIAVAFSVIAIVCSVLSVCTSRSLRHRYMPPPTAVPVGRDVGHRCPPGYGHMVHKNGAGYIIGEMCVPEDGEVRFVHAEELQWPPT